jgi:hexosaminidase
MDADLIRREFLFTARLMRHACYRGYLALETDSKKGTYMSQQMTTDIKEIINEYRLLWKARNRNGGLEDSIRRFEGMQQEYAGKFLARFLENEKAGSAE